MALASLDSDGLLLRQRGRGTTVQVPLSDKERHNGNSHKEIGVVAAGLDENYSMPLIRAIEARARRDGYSMLLVNCADAFGSNMDEILGMLKRNVSGLVIFPLITHVQDQAYRFLGGTGVPFVFVDSPVQCIDTDSVTSDSFKGAYDGVGKLIEGGCRRIAYVGISMAAWTSRERFSGYQKAIWDAGLDVDRSLIFEGYYEDAYLDITLQRILLRKPLVDGIFFANHPLAEIAFKMTATKPFPGLERVSICSFDSPPPPQIFKSRTISVKQAGAVIGEEVLNLLLERIAEKRSGRDPAPCRLIQIPPDVVRL